MADPRSGSCSSNGRRGRACRGATGRRWRHAPGRTPKPWDTGVRRSRRSLGGFAAMKAIRQAFEQTITDAEGLSGGPRDRAATSTSRAGGSTRSETLSDNVKPWPPPYPRRPGRPRPDRTRPMFRLMQAGVRIRVMVWQPTLIETLGADARPARRGPPLLGAGNREPSPRRSLRSGNWTSRSE